MRRILTISLALVALTLADCGRRHVDTGAQQAAPAADGAAPQAEPQSSSGGGLFSSACPALPPKGAVEKGLKDAMNQIYGPDEAQAKFAVSTMTPTGDCKTVSVKYKGSGTPSTTTIVYDDKWYIMLFNKRYPVP